MQQTNSPHGLSEAKRHQLLVEWNATQVGSPGEQCIHHLFEAQVERTPEAFALIFGEQRLTYRELNQRANRLAHHLQMLGVQPEILVGLCVERSIEMIVGLLAILKAGGAYVPLDPAYPVERLAFMLQDSQVEVLLTQERLQVRLPAHSARLLCLDTDREWEHIIKYSETNAQSDVKGGNLAYVIYTSGSTGQPKGTLIEHKGLVNLSNAFERCFDLQMKDRILQFSSPSFDASIFETFMALVTGATLYIGTSDSLQVGPALSQFLRDQAITVITLTPSVLKVLSSEEFPLLRIIISAGEKCPTEIIKQWTSNRQFFNAYGPTEATIWASTFECNLASQDSIIGRPIANTQLYVLDQHLQPIPIGVRGELYIGGVGVARGYLHRPELTAERFLPDPFRNDPSARLYKTGDLVRYLPDGNLEFLGRLDHQVKIRGFRIELGEIEAALTEYPAVREAVVIARENTTGDKRLVAYVVAEQSPAPSPGELRKYLQGRLPDYMLPSAFIPLDALPLSVNGKLDHRMLPEAYQVRSELENPFIAPRDSVEEMLEEIWAEVLGIEQLSVYDNFFELGGHSLLATQVASRICAVFQIDISPRSLFDAPTIASLGVTIAQLQARSTTDEKLFQILEELERLSEEEAQAKLLNKTSAMKKEQIP